jgi:hypothetical protein
MKLEWNLEIGNKGKRREEGKNLAFRLLPKSILLD